MRIGYKKQQCDFDKHLPADKSSPAPLAYISREISFINSNIDAWAFVASPKRGWLLRGVGGRLTVNHGLQSRGDLIGFPPPTPPISPHTPSTL